MSNPKTVISVPDPASGQVELIRPLFGDEQEIEAIRKAMELDQQTGDAILCHRDHLTNLLAAIDRRDAALADYLRRNP